MQPEQPARPVRLQKGAPAGNGAHAASAENVDVGAFRQGTPASQWALARYLAGRAIAEAVGRTLLVVALLVLVVAALCWIGDLHVLGVLFLIAAVAVLLLRLALIGVLRRLTAFRNFHPLEERLLALVHDTRADVHRELRRVGLPSHTLTLPLLAVRLLRRRTRGRTLERLRSFRLDRVAPRSRVDELHLLLREREASG